MKTREPYSSLKGWLVANKISQIKVAEVFETTPNVVNKKLNGTGTDFTLSEARELCNKFGIPADYFFNLFVPQKGKR